MELQLTPAETSQEASGERLWAGVGGWGPGGHVQGGEDRWSWGWLAAHN